MIEIMIAILIAAMTFPNAKPCENQECKTHLIPKEYNGTIKNNP